MSLNPFPETYYTTNNVLLQAVLKKNNTKIHNITHETPIEDSIDMDDLPLKRNKIQINTHFGLTMHKNATILKASQTRFTKNTYEVIDYGREKEAG